MSEPAVSAPPSWAAAAAARRAVRRLRPTRPEARWLWGGVIVFELITLWWLTHDDRVPDFDSGVHMIYAIVAHNEIAAGHLSAPFTDYNTYPPLVHLLGTLTISLVGVHPMAMILTANVVFVPLLAFGCYGTGTLVAGPRAGLLAGLFALGTPMFVSMMHEFDLDPPQAALVACTVWAVLASQRFQRVGISAVAGGLCGLAMLTKETSVVFVAGLLAVVLMRGGWRRWRGLIAFVFLLASVAGPWYGYHGTQLQGTLTSIGGLVPDALQAPPRYSMANLGWYLWDLLNVQTLTFFGALFFIGAVLALWRCLRERPLAPDNVYPELLSGAAFSYLAMTYLTHKDPRYTLPGLVYVAVLGTSWVVTSRRPLVHRGLSWAVAGLAAIYVVGMSFGIGHYVRLALPGPQNTIISQRQVTLYQTDGWVRGGYEQDGHVLALLQGLRAAGVRLASVDPSADELDFNGNGITALAADAGMLVAPVPAPGAGTVELLLHTPRSGDPPPCQTLNDGRGVYVARGNVAGLSSQTLGNPGNPKQAFTFVCPGRAPVMYPRPA